MCLKHCISTGDDLNTAIGQKIRDIETEYPSWTDEDSQIAKLNAASGETTEVSDELAGYLEKNISACEGFEWSF